MPAIIRQATGEDASRIAEIQIASWRAAYRHLMPESYLLGLEEEPRARTWIHFAEDAASRLLVASDAEQTVGFCHVAAARDPAPPRAAEIIALYLDPSRWRQGLGKALVQAALEWAREQGFHTVMLWTLSGNHPAQRFYEALGFQPDGNTKRTTMPGFERHEIRYLLSLNRDRPGD